MTSPLTIILQPEQIEEIQSLLTEGRHASSISAQLRAHQTGHLPALTGEHGQKC